jgi:hypothetical protein
MEGITKDTMTDLMHVLSRVVGSVSRYGKILRDTLQACMEGRECFAGNHHANREPTHNAMTRERPEQMIFDGTCGMRIRSKCSLPSRGVCDPEMKKTCLFLTYDNDVLPNKFVS